MVAARLLSLLLGARASRRAFAEGLTVSSPTQTDEDLRGHNMPEQYHCDSCKAVIFHLNADLKRKVPGRRTLKEWEYTDIFDEVCKSDDFREYGLEDFSGVNVLTGPGLPQNKKPPVNGLGSVKMKGGKWKPRLEEFCTNMINEVVGAKTLYQYYHEDGQLFADEICYRDTRDCETPETRQALAEMDEKSGMKRVKQVKKAKKQKEKMPKMPAKLKEMKLNSGINKAYKAQQAAATEKKQAQEDSLDIDVEAFLQRLAKKHGAAEDAYTASRTKEAWQKTFLEVAGKLFAFATTSSSSEL